MLIGLTGKKLVGKDTTYNRIYHLFHQQMPTERVGFADLIYVSGAEALGVTVENLHAWKGNSGIKILIISEYESENGHVLHELTVRQYLQRYGQAHRQSFGQDFWEKQIAPTIKDHQGSLLVVTDLRLPREAELLREHGGVIVRVHGDNEDQWDLHQTEQALPADLIDFHIYNSVRGDDFRALDGQIKKLMKKIVPKAGGDK